MSRGVSRVGALALAVALAVAPSIGGSGAASRCAACAPDCPMHGRRLGCHETRRPACHQAAGGLRAACGHRAEHGVETAAWRAVVPASAAVGPRVVVAALAAPPLAAPPDPFREPPTDPPRALVG
ncbi:MAG TPA: hypothetical protein VFD84_06200 [Candidatus Binatia bacterium]|nr:hypothetical protein [Candidatus Binatia bacterium]